MPGRGRVDDVRARVDAVRDRRGHDLEVGGGEQVVDAGGRSEEHTSELQSRQYLVGRLLLEKNKVVEARGLAPGDDPGQLALLVVTSQALVAPCYNVVIDIAEVLNSRYRLTSDVVTCYIRNA